MAVVNKPIRPLGPSSFAEPSSIETLKRKFQRVNQEIVKQNVSLQEQVARNRQEQHLVLQENVRLKGRIVALESKLKESDEAFFDTKKSIGDRIEMLEVIGEHLIEVTKFLKLLSLDENGRVVRSEQDEKPDAPGNFIDENVFPGSTKNLPHRKQQQQVAMMQSIAEEDDVMDLTDHIEDVSIHCPEQVEIKSEKADKRKKKK